MKKAVPAGRQDKSAETVLVISTGLAIIFFITETDAFLYASIAIGFVSIISVWIRKKIEFAWMKLAEILGAVSSRIILTVVFYFILFPVSILSKLQRKDLLQLKRKNPGESYYHDRNHLYTAEDLDKVW